MGKVCKTSWRLAILELKASGASVSELEGESAVRSRFLGSLITIRLARSGIASISSRIALKAAGALWSLIFGMKSTKRWKASSRVSRPHRAAKIRRLQMAASGPCSSSSFKGKAPKRTR